MHDILKFHDKTLPSVLCPIDATTLRVCVAWKTDSCGFLTEIGPEWFVVTGQRMVDALDVGWMRLLHLDDKERIARLWFKAVCNGRPIITAARILISTGEYTLAEVRGDPVCNDLGRIIQWRGESFFQTAITTEAVRSAG